jgi:uncharacterized protein (TIGR03435 family)
MMLRTIANLLVGAVIASCGQTSAPPPSFEVASIKPTVALENAPRGIMRGGPGFGDPGQLSCSNITVRLLINRAYGLDPAHANLIIGPPSLDQARYDIVAKIPAGATAEQFYAMLRTLLAERFGLADHWEQRNLPSYDLVVSKGGSKLREPEKPLAPPQPGQPPISLAQMPVDKDGWQVFPPGIPRIGFFGRRGYPMAHVAARMQTVADLLRVLAGPIGRPVVDKTGLTGVYDFTLDFAQPATTVNPAAGPEPSAGQAGVLDNLGEPAPDLFTAFEGQLGLKLVSTKSPVKALIVDKVNDKPTDN